MKIKSNANYERFMRDEPTTDNSVEAWNGNWNATVGTNHNIFRIVNNFKLEDAFARTKFQQCVAGTYTDPNPGRKDRAQARLAEMKAAMANYKRAFITEYMFGLKSWGDM